MMKPVVAELESKHKDISFYEIDAEDAQVFRKDDEFKVMKVPSFYLLDDKEVKHLGYEYVPKELLSSAIGSFK